MAINRHVSPRLGVVDWLLRERDDCAAGGQGGAIGDA